MTDAKKFKPTYGQLALLDWLLERDRQRFFTQWSGLNGTSEVSLYEIDGVDAEGKKKLVRVMPSGMVTSESDLAIIERLGGRRTIQIYQLVQQGLLSTRSMNRNRKAFDAFLEQFSVMNWNWAEHILLVTDKGREWWVSAGRSLFEAGKSKRDAERAAVERTVLLGQAERFLPSIPRELASKVPSGMQLPLPSRVALRPQATARVIKETEGRLYLADVAWLRQVGYRDQVVQGGKPSEYVAREHVIVDGVDNPQIVERIMRIDAEHAQDVNRIATEAVDKILPVLIELDSRLKQKDAEREDMLREALEDAKPKADDGGKAPAPGG